MRKSFSDFFRFLRTDSGTKSDESRGLMGLVYVESTPSREPYLTLHCIEGECEGHTFVVFPNDTLGRDIKNSISLSKNPFVAQIHCVFHLIHGEWYVECCGSNGISVDGVRYPRNREYCYPLEEGSILKLRGKEYNDVFKVVL